MNNKPVSYCVYGVRVSTLKQYLEGDSPEDQVKQIEITRANLATQQNKTIEVVKGFEFVESGSGEINHQPIIDAIEYCRKSDKKIEYFFIKSIDRFTRGGAEIYSVLKSRLFSLGIILVDCYGVISPNTINTLGHLGVEYKWSKYSPSFANELLTAERAKDEVRDILTRMIGAEIRYTREGYSMRNPSYGLENQEIETPEGKRTIVKERVQESEHIKKMFRLRIEGVLTDEEIVTKINDEGYRSRAKNKRSKDNRHVIIGISGETLLTVKQLHRYLRNPRYAGYNQEKWTDWKLVKYKYFDGLVTIDEFNTANRGKVYLDVTGVEPKLLNKPPEAWRLTKKKDNPLYAYKKQILCPTCLQPLLGSAPRSKSGKPSPRYHCGRKHSYWSVKLGIFNTNIEDFVLRVELHPSFKKKFNDIVLEQWEEQRRSTKNEAQSITARIIELENEQEVMIARIKQMTSQIAIGKLEEDIEKNELEVATLRERRNKKEKDQYEIKNLVNYCNYFMEHLEELLIDWDNPLRSASLFGLLFTQTPTYQQILDGTPRLAPIYRLKPSVSDSKNQNVN